MLNAECSTQDVFSNRSIWVRELPRVALSRALTLFGCSDALDLTHAH